MDTLFSLKVFRQVVQSGGFYPRRRRARHLHRNGKQHVSHLENTVQAKLLHRNSRNLSLTEAGEEYYRQCSYALDTLDDAAQKAAGGTEKPQGLLRVTMPLWLRTDMQLAGGIPRTLSRSNIRTDFGQPATSI